MAKTIFINDWNGTRLFPYTLGDLVLDKDGKPALNSTHFLAKDGHPGLVTSAERALLKNVGDSSEGIQDIYSKLSMINTGLQVNNKTLKFYNNNEATPINITSPEGQININASNENVINISLPPILSQDVNIEGLVKSIKVDRYGRVKEVAKGSLTSQDLKDKTIQNGILDQCYTKDTEVENNNKAIVNKAYVDEKVKEIVGSTINSLKFEGTLNNQSDAINKVANVQYANCYYKVTSTFDISRDYLYLETNDITVKPGDTLIVYKTEETKCKLVYIPSGNDITSVTIYDKDSTPVLQKQVGDIKLQFNNPLNIDKVNDSTVKISIPKVNNDQDGYLSKDDYQQFSSYSKSEYKPLVNAGTNGSYQLGTLTIGNNKNTIYGINNITTLQLTQGNSGDPVLKFTETNNPDVSITYTGADGINVTKKDNNTIEFSFAGSSAFAALIEAAKFMLTFEETTDTTQLDINF